MCLGLVVATLTGAGDWQALWSGLGEMLSFWLALAAELPVLPASPRTVHLKNVDIFAWRGEQLGNLRSSIYNFCLFVVVFYRNGRKLSLLRSLSVGGCVCTGAWMYAVREEPGGRPTRHRGEEKCIVMNVMKR